MKQVWKFTLKEGEIAKIEMPEFAIIHHVAEQNGELCMWAEVDIENRNVERRFEVFGTGHNMREGFGIHRGYVGTVLMCKGALVLHVFERLD